MIGKYVSIREIVKIVSMMLDCINVSKEISNVGNKNNTWTKKVRTRDSFIRKCYLKINVTVMGTTYFLFFQHRL